MSPKKKGGEEKEDRLIAALSYIFILGLIPYIAEKKDEFTRFHMRQGLALFVIWFIVFLGFYLLSFIFSPLGEGVSNFFKLLGNLTLLVYVILMVIWFYYAWQGQKREIGFVTKILKRVRV
ncbi:hypothetical protein DRP53_06990 [candidate division WOR-3 bacterium]|uniref:DUF4870 domain-containing protein n=1 Tax=candidate division WOR-3 bacterium TaxID=2052148 RepID=A0A660SG91_UNCW3|nr:MAG: hypothetical protein DRP53_06990 [candidate division WOR-3 bacterium]